MANITYHKKATIFDICPIVNICIAQFTWLKKKINVKYQKEKTYI